MRQRRPFGNRDGMALLMTVIIVALLTIVTSDYFYETWIQSALAVGYRDDTKALYAAKSGQEAAKLQLIKKPMVGMLPVPIEGEYAFVTMADESGKINLNNLTDQKNYKVEFWVGVFKRLLKRLELDSDLAGAMVDWLDKNSNVEQGGAEDGYYLSLKKPYRAKNGKLDSLDEIYNIKGFTPKVVSKLRKYITVWSAGSAKVNINTVEPEALLALDDGMTVGMVKEIVNARPFKSIASIKRFVGAGKIYANITQYIDVKGSAYSVESTATFGESTRTIRAVYNPGLISEPLYYKVF